MKRKAARRVDAKRYNLQTNFDRLDVLIGILESTAKVVENECEPKLTN